LALLGTDFTAFPREFRVTIPCCGLELYRRYIIIAVSLGQSSHFNYPHSVVGIVLVALAFVVQPVAVWLSVQQRIPQLKDYMSMFRSLHRRNGHMLVFFGIANVFLGLLALDAANQNVAYTQSFKVAYGVVVALMIMMYMLFQPRAAAFKVRPPRRALSLFFRVFTFRCVQRGEHFKAAFVRNEPADETRERLCFLLIIRSFPSRAYRI
jgi:hypothetical protein